eukprot:CAMPEP_0201597088 /NCGR_PEP_ID=MMETSP0190_2-20130828/193657_1 /ASSEMBLY_ACC=CAM_ASM_000263 /TAXON_ID=37353 /ORGANISM="Rosalina sp." /LENGTH=280 /DNA_ID=CAMNT_0048057861 /DNA_START=822 /DNA_END=1665 /DNA_ORIENTATION=+
MTLSLDDDDYKSNKSIDNDNTLAILNNNTTNTHSLSVNPVYLFNTSSNNSTNKGAGNRTTTRSQRTRARTVSNATLGTIGTIEEISNNNITPRNKNNDKTINEIDRMISQSIFSMKREMDEEDDLEIDGHKGVGSKITNITNFNFNDINDIDDMDNKEEEDGDNDEVSQIYLDGNLDLLSDVDNNIMPTTPISTPPSTPRGGKKSIDQTYYEKEEESNEPSAMSQNASSPSPLILVPNHQIAIGTTSPITIDSTAPITIQKKEVIHIIYVKMIFYEQRLP